MAQLPPSPIRHKWSRLKSLRFNIEGSLIENAIGLNPIASDDDYIYLVFRKEYGGIGNIEPQLWKYNLRNEMLSMFNVNNMPDHVNKSTVLLHKKVLFVYGGTGIEGQREFDNQLYVCLLDGDNVFFKLIRTKGRHPKKLFGQALMLKDNYLYVFGGKGFQEYYNIDVHGLDLLTSEWTRFYTSRGQEIPIGVAGHKAVLVKNKVYIIGGISVPRWPTLDVLPVFDLETNTWEMVSTRMDGVEKEFRNGRGYPGPRMGNFAININDKYILLFGGRGDEGFLVDAFWVYNLTTRYWARAIYRSEWDKAVRDNLPHWCRVFMEQAQTMLVRNTNPILLQGSRSKRLNQKYFDGYIWFAQKP